MKPVIIIALAFVLLVPVTAFASEGFFIHDFGRQMSHNPNVCIFQPDDSRVDEDRWDRWYFEARKGIDSWKTMLKQSSDGNWDIDVFEVTLDKADLLNINSCDITVEFVEKPYVENGYYVNALGWWEDETDSIKIVYSSFEFCGKEYFAEFDIMVHSYCFSDNLERAKQMGNTVQHEFGHALGLGHFRGYDNSFTQSWYDGGEGAPSIMAWIEPNEDIRQVTKIDVEKIHELYSKAGFGKRKDFTPLFNERVIVEPVIGVSSRDTIILNDDIQRTTYSISGNVPDKIFKRGTYLEIIIQKPDGTSEVEATSVSKTRKAFNYPLIFDSSSQSGKYEIALQFDGKIFAREEVIVQNSISSSSKTVKNLNSIIEPKEVSKIPPWLKNNAKWWSDGTVDDSTFTQGIGFLIKEQIVGIDSLPEQTSDVAEQKVPDWIKNNAGWWADGMISEDDFIKGIKYLVEKRIIPVE